VIRGGVAALDSRGMPANDRRQPDTAADVDPDVARLLGLRPTDAEDVPTSDEVDSLGTITDTRIYEGDLEARPAGVDQPDEDPAENLELLVEDELRDGETDDPNEAAEEGFTWVPPVDPPIVADERGDAVVAAGFGTTAEDEPFDADHHAAPLSPYDEVEARVLEALRADAATSSLVDGLEVDAEGGVIRVAGEVPGIDDEDEVVRVIEEVSGVREVESRVTVGALESTPRD
jgi:hypothetical protein